MVSKEKIEYNENMKMPRSYAYLSSGIGLFFLVTAMVVGFFFLGNPTAPSSLNIASDQGDVVSAEILNVGALTIYLRDANSPDFLNLPPVQRNNDTNALWYWTTDLRKDVEGFLRTPSPFDRFTAVSVPGDKEFIVFAVSKNRFYGGVNDRDFKNVLGSIDTTNGSVVVNELEEFDSDVTDIIWLEDNKSFAVVTDSEFAFCDIPREFGVNACRFKITPEDISQALGVEKGPNFIPNFRSIRWTDENKTEISFSTAVNTWTTKVPGRANWQTSRDGNLSLLDTQDQIEYEASEKLGVEFGCDEREDAAECFNLVQWMFSTQNARITFAQLYGSPRDDTKLRTFFQKNFPGIRDVQVSSFEYGIEQATVTKLHQTVPKSSGDPQLWRIVSFRSTFLGEERTHVVLFRDLPAHETADPKGSGRDLSGVMRTLGSDLFFANQPEFLVIDHAPFFLVNRTPIHAACEPFRWSKVLYYLDDNSIDLKSSWVEEYYRNGRFGSNLEIENTFADIRFEDLDGDGNQEIIQEGMQTFCSASHGGCYSKDCNTFTGSATIRRIFDWNPATKTFEEQG